MSAYRSPAATEHSPSAAPSGRLKGRRSSSAQQPNNSIGEEAHAHPPGPRLTGDTDWSRARFPAISDGIRTATDRLMASFEHVGPPASAELPQIG